MNTALYTFEPDLSDIRATLWTGAFIGLAALAGAVLLIRSRRAHVEYNYRMLGSMLLFFVFLLAAGTTVFSWWTTARLSPVRIYADAIETPYGRAAFESIVNASIEEKTQKSFVNPNLTTARYSVLVIGESSGKAHVLSEENYDLIGIMRELKGEIGRWKEKN